MAQLRHDRGGLSAAVSGHRQAVRAAAAAAHRLRHAAGEPAGGGYDGARQVHLLSHPARRGRRRRGAGQGCKRHHPALQRGCGHDAVQPPDLQRGPAVLPLPGRQAGHLPADHLHGRRRDDRLRSPDRQPEEPAAGRCRTAGHLHHLHRREADGLLRCGGRLHRHHRRRGRPDGHLRHHQARTAPAGRNRRRGLLLHGAGSGHSAAHHEGTDHQEGARHPHAAAASGVPHRDGHLPDHGHHRGVPAAA